MHSKKKVTYCRRNHDIRTIQELLGRCQDDDDLYATVPSVTLKEAKSPLDFFEKANVSFLVETNVCSWPVSD